MRRKVSYLRYIDLSHTIVDQLPGYPGDGCVQLIQQPSASDSRFRNQVLTIGMHMGTHLDAPGHMLFPGPAVAELPLQATCGRTWLFDCRDQNPIILTAEQCAPLAAGDKVLLWTGWDRHFGEDDYFTGFPLVSEETARRLVDSGVSMVGMDTPSPDRQPYEVHRILFAAGVLIAENLTGLGQLQGHNPFELLVLPLKVKADGGPARVVARLPE
ncbi:MAG TPA: cyclase family protein [Firmicutes bacterium]|nr:cyclase family protein [Bacillota bacterium]